MAERGGEVGRPAPSGSNSFSGFADVVTCGLTARYREGMGYDSFVDTSSAMYTSGSGSGSGSAVVFREGEILMLTRDAYGNQDQCYVSDLKDAEDTYDYTGWFSFAVDASGNVTQSGSLSNHVTGRNREGMLGWVMVNTSYDLSIGEPGFGGQLGDSPDFLPSITAR